MLCAHHLSHLKIKVESSWKQKEMWTYGLNFLSGPRWVNHLFTLGISLQSVSGSNIWMMTCDNRPLQQHILSLSISVTSVPPTSCSDPTDCFYSALILDCGVKQTDCRRAYIYRNRSILILGGNVAPDAREWKAKKFSWDHLGNINHSILTNWVTDLVKEKKKKAKSFLFFHWSGNDNFSPSINPPTQ